MILYQEYPYGSFGYVTRFPSNSLVFEGNTPQTFSETVFGEPAERVGRGFLAYKDYGGDVRLCFYETPYYIIPGVRYVDLYNSWVSGPWHPPTADNPLIMYPRYWQKDISEFVGASYPPTNHSQCGQLTVDMSNSISYEDTPVALSDILDSEPNVQAVVAFSTPDEFQWENKINTFEVLV
jgi:hypothetical protein